MTRLKVPTHIFIRLPSCTVVGVKQHGPDLGCRYDTSRHRLNGEKSVPPHQSIVFESVIEDGFNLTMDR
ncbi:hypothetical protein BLA23254_06403 [Burkholderia lata]|uniref:Uncharacterized protein n=1 Tax=Burkholderia lata (strain ATCC 17760 / DSM 23089 / LMG 22485 / NCIMB 9086 / R18194 / 383) TaxID=482957 RepID=A0A6P2RI93_BURL3|nr:hypothetical protein BLA23254_06403 [Burkholderia lata]